MKHQYFGDLNDDRKYGLLRALVSGANLRPLVAWMLTPGDGRTDGRKIKYLAQAARYERFDAELFRTLGLCLSTTERHVGLFENSNLLPRAAFHSEMVPDDRIDRARWFESLKVTAAGYDLVFLDPDNGLEVPSKPMGRRHSSKYLLMIRRCARGKEEPDTKRLPGIRFLGYADAALFLDSKPHGGVAP